MSRHRQIKKNLYDYDDGYDDDDDYSDYAVSPSPSSQQYLYSGRSGSTSTSAQHPLSAWTPPPPPPPASTSASLSPTEEAATAAGLTALSDALGPDLMGFTAGQAKRLLLQFQFDVEQAAEYIIMHPDEAMSASNNSSGESVAAAATNLKQSASSPLRTSNSGGGDVFSMELGVDDNHAPTAAATVDAAGAVTQKKRKPVVNLGLGGGVFVLGPSSSPSGNSTTSVSPQPLKASAPATPAAAAAANNNNDLRQSSFSGFGSPPPIVHQRTRKQQQTLDKLVADAAGSLEPVKRHFNLVVIGHVDAGKSTINGHLLYLVGRVSQRAMHKFETESKAAGKGSFSFAWVMDEHAEERARGVTVDVGVNSFETDHCMITLLDAPGHRDFIPNMITGAAQADVAVLVLDATTGEFETGFRQDGQTREHAILARSLGVRQLIVAVNKMDIVNWSQDRYQDICNQVKVFLKQTGFKEKQLIFLPVSGITGQNLTKNSLKEKSTGSGEPWSWYKGPSLLEIIDQFDPTTAKGGRPSADEEPLPFRLCLSDIYKSKTTSVVTVAGKLDAGFLAPGDRVLVVPSNELVTVKSILNHEAPLQYAERGQNVDVGLANADMAQIRVGDVLCDPADPLVPTTRFRAQIIVLGDLKVPLTKGTTCILHAHVTATPARISRLISLVDRSTAEVLKKKPRVLFDGQAAIVEITTDQPVCLEVYAKYPQLGRFMLRSQGRSIAAGIVLEVLTSSNKKDES